MQRIYAEAARWAGAHASSDDRKRIAPCLIADPRFVVDAVRCQRIGGELSRRAAHESGTARLALATLADMALQVGIPPALVAPSQPQLAAYRDHIVRRDRALLREATRRRVPPIVRYARLMLGT